MLVKVSPLDERGKILRGQDHMPFPNLGVIYENRSPIPDEGTFPFSFIIRPKHWLVFPFKGLILIPLRLQI